MLKIFYILCFSYSLGTWNCSAAREAAGDAAPVVEGHRQVPAGGAASRLPDRHPRSGPGDPSVSVS